jgi:hypothetical protein
LFHLRRRDDDGQRGRDEEWRSLVDAVTRPGEVSELDEQRFREYVQRHVLAGSSLEEQAARNRRSDRGA